MSAADGRRPGVALLVADPALGLGLPNDDLPTARRVVAAPREDLPAGPWEPPTREAYGDGTFALLLLKGLLTRDTVLAGRSAAQLLGPGDVLQPWPTGDSLLPAVTRWAVREPVVMAVLDDRFLAAGRRWPALSINLQTRLARQADRAILHAALGQLPRVELRIVALLWHLAERWGKVTPEGVVVPLRLTHETLGRLVGAQRPTVTLALRALVEAGSIVRRDDGCWILTEGSDQQLVPSADQLRPALTPRSRPVVAA